MRSRLSTVLPSGADYSVDLADKAARIVYHSPLPSSDGFPIFVLNGAALPDASSDNWSELLPYVIARLPDEDELIGGKGYELVFFAGGEIENGSHVEKKEPSWRWFVDAYESLSRAMRKRLQKLYLVHERRWTRFVMETFSTVVSPKFRKKTIHASDLTALAVHIPIEDLLIPRSTYLNDRRRAKSIYVPYATGRRAFGARVPFPISSTGAPRLPRILREATSFLLTDQNIKTHGLFRVNASKITVEILAEAYDRGQKFIIWEDGPSMLTFGHWKKRCGEVVVKELQCMRYEAFSISAAAGLIKAWYSKLHQPIFPQSSWAFLDRVLGDQTTPIQISTLLDLIGESSDWSPVTKQSREILRLHLLPLLAIVAENEAWNEMAPQNLAICFAPNLVLLSGQDQVAGLQIINVVIRFLRHAIELWNTGLSAACNMDRSRFEQSLRIPESIDDREDSLDLTDPSARAPTTQSQGVIEFHLGDSDNDDDEDEDRPPLPPRNNVAPITESGMARDEAERPPVAPKDAIAQGLGCFPDNASAVRRKPLPPAAPPPRYSWESTPTEALIANTLTGDGRLGAAGEPQHDHRKR